MDYIVKGMRGKMLLLMIISLFACGLHAAESSASYEKSIEALKLSCSPPLPVPPSPHRDDRRALNIPKDVPPHIMAMHKAALRKEIERACNKNHAPQAQPIQPAALQMPLTQSAEPSKKPKSSKKTTYDDDIFAFEWE